MTPALADAIPAHVPPHLVRATDLWADLAAAGGDAHAAAARLHDDTPPIVWVPRLGYLAGCWVPRRAEDLRRILQDAETFSSVGVIPFPQMLGEAWRLIPLEVDPPDHAKYRALLNPLFTPKKIEALERDIRELATQLVKDLPAQGGCDFNAGFAEPFPAMIFLRLMGWPVEEAPRFVSWTHTLVKSMDMAAVVVAAREITTYLRGRIAERRAAPADDFTSFVIGCEVDGRPLSEDEVLGICFLVFIAGLDTVTSSLGFHCFHLARHPEQQALLRARPELLPQAVEELLRAYSTVNMRRTVMRDVQVGEVLMKAGDTVLISTELANLDPEEFADPKRIDFNRGDGNIPHLAFSAGPHRCLGSHLARRELRIALEVLLQALPPFRLSPDHTVAFRASGVFGLDNLHLVWEVPA